MSQRVHGTQACEGRTHKSSFVVSCAVQGFEPEFAARLPQWLFHTKRIVVSVDGHPADGQGAEGLPAADHPAALRAVLQQLGGLQVRTCLHIKVQTERTVSLVTHTQFLVPCSFVSKDARHTAPTVPLQL